MAKLEAQEYKEALLRFGKNVNKILGDSYQATKPDAPPKQRATAITTARGKLDEYEELIAQLEGKQLEGATKRFGSDMKLLRERLTQLEKGA